MACQLQQTWKSRFERPRIHFTANSWINDPCAPGYDPWTNTYHVFYECNPSSCEWGNMSWGHLVSRDLLTWTPASVSPVLVPDQIYDSEGVFTGCWVPATNANDKTLRVAYSSVKHLPFHWSTPPYPRHAAGLALATSRDGGITWEKSPRNPILPGEPDSLNITGFRDPYVTAPLSIHHSDPAKLYGLISGGIQDLGPTTFLYEISQENLENWKYLNPLVDVPLRFQPSEKWSGNYGINWECTNLVTLCAGDVSRHFLIIGAEGDVEKEHVKKDNGPPGVPSRTIRAQLWMSGHLTTNDEGIIKFRYEHGGFLDNGPYYAANSFWDPIGNRRIVHGWIPEEDITADAAKAKGWNGSLAILREVFLLRIPNVKGTCRSELSEIYPFERLAEPDGSTTILTLGVRPIREMARLRETSARITELESTVMLPGPDTAASRTIARTQSPSWELEAEIAVHPGCQSVGFHLRHSNDLSIRTTLTFCIAKETILIERKASNDDQTINKCPDAGPFTLLALTRPDAGDEVIWEKLRIRIFSDGDILEIFANDRFALATMVYSENYGPDMGGITAFATGEINSASFETVKVWDGLDIKYIVRET
ncbi:Beta-fructofuranosidase, cell wall isozyme [Fusarium oxysporum f. sp. cubense]|uniref:Beta-fructofuranosidase, cell wall isozyme n=1 Tax=Fusarium oxysporum f. sp. cubense TaxID=61366 RepID=A0A559KYQ7_FUSOC|nr:Beta-fructofuranosidase, cell wall isozyme [Fusarium oxysporum f. sp. cubense]